MDDKEIISAISSRDEAGLKELEQKYGRLLKSVCANIVGKDDADDCANDAVLAVWDAIPPAKPENLLGFAAKIARRKAIDRQRRALAEKRSENESLLLSELGECVPSKINVEQEALANFTAEDINSWLGSLKPPERRIFLLRYFAGESEKDIAKKLGISASAAAQRLYRLREKLKSYLEERGTKI